MYAQQRFAAAGQHKFALSFFKIMKDQTPGQNLFVSPLSAYNALLLAYFGSEGETMTSLHEVLNLKPSDNKTDILQTYIQLKQKSLSNQMKSVEKVYITNEAKLK